MAQILLSIPNGEIPFLTTLAEKMWWNVQTRKDSVEKFIRSCPSNVDITDTEINAVRYGK